MREPVERELAEAKTRRDDSPPVGRGRRTCSIASRRSHGRSTEPRMERSAPSARATCNGWPRSGTRRLPSGAGARGSAAQAARAVEPMVKEEVDEDDIAAVVAAWTKIPRRPAARGRGEKLVQHGGAAAPAGGGQDAAIDAVSDALSASHARACRTRTAHRSFVFLGPTGVGKTRAAKARGFTVRLRRAIVRLDMSEYMEKHTVSRLVGAPPGVRRLRRGRAADRGGPAPSLPRDPARRDREGAQRRVQRAASAARRRAPDGRPGRTVDFRNTVVIMTSNIRSQEQLLDHFRPEFVNRVDEIVVFEALTRDQIGAIVELQLERLRGGWPTGRSRSSCPTRPWR